MPEVPVVLDLLQRLPQLLPLPLPPPPLQEAMQVETLVVIPEPTREQEPMQAVPVVQAAPKEAEVVAEADTTVKDSPHETLSHRRSAGRPPQKKENGSDGSTA